MRGIKESGFRRKDVAEATFSDGGLIRNIQVYEIGPGTVHQRIALDGAVIQVYDPFFALCRSTLLPKFEQVLEVTVCSALNETWYINDYGIFTGYIASGAELLELKSANKLNIRGIKSLGWRSNQLGPSNGQARL